MAEVEGVRLHECASAIISISIPYQIFLLANDLQFRD